MRQKKTVLAALLLSAFLFGALPAFAQMPKATVHKENVPIKEILALIEKSTDCSFFWNTSDFDAMKTVTVNVDNAPVTEIISSILPGFECRIDKSKIMLVKKAGASKAARNTPWTITGSVYENSGEPLPGASIVVRDGNQQYGTISGMDGKFVLEIPGGAREGLQLTASFIGFLDRKITLSPSQDNIKIFLSEDAVALLETVVVGYGTQKKVNLTGAIATVSSKSLESRSATTLTHMLQGSVPGLNVTTSSGRPGNAASVNIRGVNSINGGNPLILIDGAEGDMSRVNPNDVESISVIKDASAAAIYGARASFGVILITTKNGTEGSGLPTVRYSGRIGWQQPTTSTEFETRGYYSVYLNDLFYNAANGKNYTFYTEKDMQELWARRNDKTENPERPWVMIDQREGRDTYVYYANTDWYHELFQDNHIITQHNVSLTGGTKHIKYFISGGYNYEEGVFRRNTDKLNKYNFRSKINFDINRYVSLSNNTSYYSSDYEYPGRSGVNTAFSLMTVHALASYPAHNPDGTSIGYTSFANNNYVMDGMLTVLDNPNYKNGDTNDNLLTTTELTVKPVKGLEIKGNFTYGLNQYRNYNRSTNTSYSRYPGEIITLNSGNSIDRLQEIIETQHYFATNIFATYEHSFKQAHNLKVMAGYNWETKRYKDITARGYYLMSESLNDLDLIGSGDDGNKRMEVEGGQNEYALAGFFARVNYDYAGKYLFEVSGRYDGSSRFSENDRWGFFPSASAGWRISEEKFFSKIKDKFNNLKIRYSYGSLGNQQVGYYDYIRKISIGTSSYLFGTGSKPTIATIGAPVASDLTWEKVQQHNLGLDASWLGNRLSLTAEAYIRDTKDMLTAGVALPATYGASSPKMNAADLRTKGYELSLTWKDLFQLAGHPFSYNITAIFSDYVTDVTKYDNPEKSFALSHYVGKRWGEIWGYRTDGLFDSDEEAAAWPVDQSMINQAINSAAGDQRGLHGGDVKFKDLDGDNKITLGQNTVNNPGDREVIGNTEPRFNYGANLGFQWLGIDFSIFFQGIGKMDWYPQTNTLLFWGPYARPYATLIPKDFHKMIWSEDNKDAYYPRPRGYAALGSNRELTVNNDRYLQNIAYCRLKNLTVGYTLPQKWTRKAGIEALRFYFTGENLAYWSGIKSDYIDPEMAQTNSQMRIYPWQKSFMFGVDLTF